MLREDCDEIIALLDAGKIVFDGTANEFCSSGVPLAKEFQIGL